MSKETKATPLELGTRGGNAGVSNGVEVAGLREGTLAVDADVDTRGGVFGC